MATYAHAFTGIEADEVWSLDNLFGTVVFFCKQGGQSVSRFERKRRWVHRFMWFSHDLNLILVLLFQVYGYMSATDFEPYKGKKSAVARGDAIRLPACRVCYCGGWAPFRLPY